MRLGRHLTALAALCLLLILVPVALRANERQIASPVWGSGDSDILSFELYDMLGLDFDAATPGIELPEEPLFDCALESAGGGMIQVKYTNKLRLRSSIDGSISFTTDIMVLRSQPFPDPFNPTNQDMGGQLLYAYVSGNADVTSQLQSAVTMALDPTETFCDDETFPSRESFGVNMATTGMMERSLVFADSLSGGYVLKTDPGDIGWNGFSALEGIGTYKYWAIEATSGAGNKGAVLNAKSFDEQWESNENEATTDWTVDTELSMIGDMRGTGGDVVRIVEVKPHADPDKFLRRARHFNVRTGALIGSRVINAPLR